MTITRTLARLGALTTLTAGTVALGAAAASAHVTVDPSSTSSGGYTVLTFSNGHGCDGSPTTKITISIPDGIYSVTPTRHADYTIEKVTETLDTPVDDGHGGQYTERISEVVYTATTPLPDGYRDAFELSLRLPEGEAGDVLAFPTIQTCEEGETAWIDADPDADAPAPSITLSAPAGDGHGHGDDQDEADHDGQAASGDGSSSTLGWLGVGLGAVGAVAGGTALARSGRRA